jgi:hypothetical protein
MPPWLVLLPLANIEAHLEFGMQRQELPEARSTNQCGKHPIDFLAPVEEASIALKPQRGPFCELVGVFHEADK